MDAYAQRAPRDAKLAVDGDRCNHSIKTTEEDDDARCHAQLPVGRDPNGTVWIASYTKANSAQPIALCDLSRTECRL
jgi:hypothetical protein